MYDRMTIDALDMSTELKELKLSDATLSIDAVMYMGFQRTKNISRASREAWMSGNPALLRTEAAERRQEIINDILLEVYREYIPLREFFHKHNFNPKKVIDIGCGQAVNDLFLHRDFKPHFTLVDIEATEEQYHAWARKGSGYASLTSAKEMLHDNGVAATKVTTINPMKNPEAMNGLSGDLVTSLYSCGFHYPIDEYADLMAQTIANGGYVCLDLRKRYFNRKPAALARMLEIGTMHILYMDTRSTRVLISKGE